MEKLNQHELRLLLEMTYGEYYKHLGMLTELKNNPDKGAFSDPIEYQTEFVTTYDGLIIKLSELYIAADEVP